ncbi:hypothetical protein APY03_1468 [Variovorax sp. WDL1]|nr:hypothetical protein APY03_1468 [Variovorax sp. WDL1]
MAPPDHAILADALCDALQRARPTATVKVNGGAAQITSLSTRDGNALVHVVLEDAEDSASFGCATVRVLAQSSSSADGLCFAKLDLSGSDLRGADLQGVTLLQCSLQGASLEHADCTGTSFSDTNLFGTNLANARLNEVRFRKCFVNGKTALPEEMLPSSLRHPDEMIRPGDVLVTTSVLKLPHDLRKRTHVLPNETAPYKNRLHFMRDAWFKAGLDQPGGKYTVMPSEVREDRLDSGRVYATDSQMPQLHFESSHFFMEGGNVFVLPNGTCVVGEESLPDRTSEQAREQSLGKMRHVLGSEVVVLPQIFFHIDLHVSFLGDRWMIHSFDEAVTFLTDNRDALIARLGQEPFDTLLEANKKMAIELEHSFVDHSSDLLASTGYPVSKWCGLLYAEKMKNGNYPRALSTFTNGVLVEGSPGQPNQYLVAMSNAVPEHRKYVEDRCKEHGLEVAYAELMLSDEDDEPTDGAGYARSTGAGVRCLIGHNPFGILDHPPRND